MTDLTRTEIINSIKGFTKLRDYVLHDEPDNLEHHLKRFVRYCEDDTLIQQILSPLLASQSSNSNQWWEKLRGDWYRQGPKAWEFPTDPDEELTLRFSLLKDIVSDDRSFISISAYTGAFKLDKTKQQFLSVVIEPCLSELTDRISELANIPSSEVRALQAVPPSRIPGEKETKIFLSHRSVDKELVIRYYNALKVVGFEPWLDQPEMPAGVNPDRGIKQGFIESCAAVFFITENFKDERFLKDEIDNAKIEERKKGDRFKIITLLFSDNVKVPPLLENYTYKYVQNDLEGFYEIIRALPIELGRVLWKEEITSKG